jgi:hypothetical protein
MRDDPTSATLPLGWKLAALVAGALGLVAVVAAWWFGFALLAIWLGLPGE